MAYKMKIKFSMILFLSMCFILRPKHLIQFSLILIQENDMTESYNRVIRFKPS